MNKLSPERQKLVLDHLVEGSSIRSIERITGIHQNTIMRLLVACGNRAQDVLDNEIKDVPCKHVELDETWCFVQCKQGHLPIEERGGERGDQYVFVALDAESKLAAFHLIGKRDDETTVRFLQGLKKHIRGGRVQFSTDGFLSYPNAIWNAFMKADHGQVIKHFGPEIIGERRYSPPKVLSVEKKVRFGNPDPNFISTSYVERQNLTMRMSMRRFTRLTNGFSKKLENLVAACALHFYHYNFMRIHGTLRMTPAMAANLTGSIWDWDAVL
jgi:IS1 family transposase